MSTSLYTVLINAIDLHKSLTILELAVLKGAFTILVIATGEVFVSVYVKIWCTNVLRDAVTMSIILEVLSFVSEMNSGSYESEISVGSGTGVLGDFVARDDAGILVSSFSWSDIGMTAGAVDWEDINTPLSALVTFLQPSSGIEEVDVFVESGEFFLTFARKIIENNIKEVWSNNTVVSRYLEIEGTLRNTSRYPYFDISDL